MRRELLRSVGKLTESQNTQREAHGVVLVSSKEENSVS